MQLIFLERLSLAPILYTRLVSPVLLFYWCFGVRVRSVPFRSHTLWGIYIPIGVHVISIAPLRQSRQSYICIRYLAHIFNTQPWYLPLVSCIFFLWSDSSLQCIFFAFFSIDTSYIGISYTFNSTKSFLLMLYLPKCDDIVVICYAYCMTHCYNYIALQFDWTINKIFESPIAPT